MKTRSVGLSLSVAVIATMLAAACSAPGASKVASAPSSAPKLPTKPITLHILDVSGDLTTSKPLIVNYVKAHPKLISKVEYESGSATDVAGKLQAQEKAGRVDIDLVLTGTGALSQMSSQKELIKLLPAYASALPDLKTVLTPGGTKLQNTSGGYGVIDEGGGGGGPILEYSTKRVTSVPTTPAALLAWAKAHPGRFNYASPTAGSGPANALIAALPYQLGDKNPTDPVNGWAKTWTWLEQMNKYITKYPIKTTDSFQGLADGTYDITAAQPGWDVIEHSPGGPLNSSFAVSTFSHPILITDGHFGAIPKGVSADHVAVDLDLLKWLLRPAQQALTYPTFSSFPVKGVELSMATPAAQAAFKKYGRPSFVTQLAKAPVKLPLSDAGVQAMYDKWNKLIGAKK